MKQTRWFLLTFMLALTSAAGQPTSSITPLQLRCDYAKNPLGVDSSPPRLFWQLAGGGRGLFQSAYQILVASKAEILAQDQGDLWDLSLIHI